MMRGFLITLCMLLTIAALIFLFNCGINLSRFGQCTSLETQEQRDDAL